MRKKSRNLAKSRPRHDAIIHPILTKFGRIVNLVDVITPAKFDMDRIENICLSSGQIWACAIYPWSRPYHFA